MKRYSVVLLCFDGEHFVEIAGPRPDAEAWQGWSANMRANDEDETSAGVQKKEASAAAV